MLDKWNLRSKKIIEGAYQNLPNSIASNERFLKIFDPLKYIYINPNEIQFRCGLSYPQKGRNKKRFRNYGKIIRGKEWEHLSRPTQNYKLYKCLNKRIIDGLSWESTGVFDLKLNEIKKAQRPVDGCLTIEDLEIRYKRIDNLIHSLTKERFKRQIDINDEANILNEMFVSIGKTGRMYFSSGGNHRLFIAQILRLEKIPFLVLSRDIRWVQTVKKIMRNNMTISHPDISQITSSGKTKLITRTERKVK